MEGVPLKVRVSIFVLALVGLALLTGEATASPWIHAHRGGPIENGKGAMPENSLPAFRQSAARGFTLEADVKLTADKVPVIIHDDELDRTTNCTGPVKDKTLAELENCEIDVVGIDDTATHLPAGDKRRTNIPTLTQLLELLKQTGASANIELKNLPTDNDWDPTFAYSEQIANQIKDSGVPSSQLIIQSFLATNLTKFAEIDPAPQTSYLTLNLVNSTAINTAKTDGIDWVSPEWPVDQEFVSNAHHAGLRVVPWTIDDATGVREATALGVDALISNDPMMARVNVKKAAPGLDRIPKAPSARACRSTFARDTRRPARAMLKKKDAKGGPRVFAMQFKQEARNIKSYASFRKKIECMIKKWVVPYKAKGRPNVVAFNEDVGLMTLGTGSRGATARAAFAKPSSVSSCTDAAPPCRAIYALTQVTAAYAGPNTEYQSRFSIPNPFARGFVAAADTDARGWMQVFSDMARRYKIYIVGSNTQPRFRESQDPAEINLFRDPDLPKPKSVYVATGPQVYNEAFMWGPKLVRQEGPRPLRNVVASNLKVPLTSIEVALGLTPGPKSGADAIANLKPYRIPGTKARVGFATSLPAFQFGYDIGSPISGGAPCADVSVTYMRCLSHLGTNLVMQDEANPGEWASAKGSYWQPLDWMGSTWRSVVDPGVKFTYNVTPHMVGNLGDLPFDGQTAITQRGLLGKKKCNYVGNRKLLAEDASSYRRYAGPKRQFITLAPWVRKDGPRAQLRKTGAALLAASGKKMENRYLETAAIADLPFPPKKKRKNCIS
jgi:glycerophosphoryl diester phosphodiesterase